MKIANIQVAWDFFSDVVARSGTARRAFGTSSLGRPIPTEWLKIHEPATVGTLKLLFAVDVDIRVAEPQEAPMRLELLSEVILLPGEDGQVQRVHRSHL